LKKERKITMTTPPQTIEFGTDGWRAVMAEEFTLPNVRRVAEALGRILPKRSTVVIGYDHRFFSDKFAVEAGAVLAAQKHKITMIDRPTTTPALSFAVRTLRTKAGVMITASHNPPIFNGFKVKLPPGCSADPLFTKQLEEAIQTDVPYSSTSFPRKSFSPDKAYIQFLKSKLERRLWRNPKLRIVADGMFGYGGKYWEEIFAALNIKGKVIRSQRDPLFGGISPEPIEKNLQALAEAVRGEKAAIGLAVDGDGDRLGVLDETGAYVPPHHVFPLILLHLLETRRMKGRVVQAVSLGYLSERIAKKFGLEFTEVPVGFKYVVEEMRKGKVLLGGEESGGYGVGLWAPERDGILSGLLLLELVLTKKQPLSVLRKNLEAEYGASFFQRQDYPIRAPIADKKRWAEALAAKLSKHPDKAVKEMRTLDGLKIIWENDWLLLRPSGTEPLLRTYAESPTKDRTKQLLQKAQEISTMKINLAAPVEAKDPGETGGKATKSGKKSETKGAKKTEIGGQ
jgi:phosphomannomutase